MFLLKSPRACFFVGTLTSRCSYNFTRTHPPTHMTAREMVLLSVSAIFKQQWDIPWSLLALPFSAALVCVFVCVRADVDVWVEGILRGLVKKKKETRDEREHQFTSFLLQFCVMMRLVIYFHSQHCINEGASDCQMKGACLYNYICTTSFERPTFLKGSNCSCNKTLNLSNSRVLASTLLDLLQQDTTTGPTCGSC